jgi:hypothetical protein
MAAGRILRSGGKELALELERTGYDWVDQELARLAPAHARWRWADGGRSPAPRDRAATGRGLAGPGRCPLPSRRQEDWRFTDLAALTALEPQAIVPVDPLAAWCCLLVWNGSAR